MYKRSARRTTSRKVPAQIVFFPAAGIYAALLVPLSLWAMYYDPLLLPGLSSGPGHAQELLFGFALAVIAGYLLGPLPPRRLALLFLLWLAARLGYLLMPDSILAPMAGSGFALLLAINVVPRFRAAKKWRNRLLAPLLLLICLLAVALLWLIHSGAAMGLQHGLIYQAVLLLALLMLFMGGRVIAPAVAGHRVRQGGTLEARVQPRIEGLSIVTMLLAIVLTSGSMTRDWAGLLLLSAGLLTLVRLLRWQLWHCGQRLDLLCLGVGYGWLVAGLMANGFAQWNQQLSSALIHLLALGAMGTLTSLVMMRTAMQHSGSRIEAEPKRARIMVVITLLIAIATLLRLVAPSAPTLYLPLLWSAAAAWSLAWLLTAQQVWRASVAIWRRQAVRRAEPMR